MTVRALQWGLLSTAWINDFLIPPLRCSPRNWIAAVGSRSLEKAQEYAAKWHIPRAYGSYDELLADPEIDVIYVSLPNSMHTEWTVKAAQAGKHVLCEKPMPVTLDEMEAIAAAAKENNVVIAEAFMYLHHPQTLKVKELVDGGAIGRVINIRASFSHNFSTDTSVRMIKDLCGGSIWDVGCYPISYARYIMGQEPIEVFGRQIWSRTDVDQSFFGTLRFPGDIYMQFDSGIQTPWHQSMEIVGAKGYIALKNPWMIGGWNEIDFISDGGVQHMGVPRQDLYLGEVEDMADSIRDGKSQRVSLEFSRGNVAAIRALLRSAETRRPVEMA